MYSSRKLNWTMPLKDLVLDPINVLVWCRASFCRQYSINLSWEWQMQVLHSRQRDFEPLLLQKSGQVTTWCWWRKTFSHMFNFTFHAQQITLSPVLHLCALVHYQPDTWHDFQGTLFELLGANAPPEWFGSPWQWHTILVVGLRNGMIVWAGLSLIHPMLHSGHMSKRQWRWTNQRTVRVSRCLQRKISSPLKPAFCIGSSDRRFGYSSSTMWCSPWKVLVETVEYI